MITFIDMLSKSSHRTRTIRCGSHLIITRKLKMVDFLRYIDSYIAHFNISINYNCSVDSAFIDQSNGKWRLLVTNNSSGADEIYEAEFLVVASGENSEEYIPNIKGLESYQGESMHCSKYLNGREMYKKNVLVVGCGNSGMEIAYDLSTWGAYTSIVVRSQVNMISQHLTGVQAAASSTQDTSYDGDAYDPDQPMLEAVNYMV
ncbi:probable indole-3-pyruvate monooxygenase YUCCA10 [Arachis ipaensis]|uniref:probable indole-3-pyruvate monooxygenase YUCCA10 n=1 Tax=Arachis ipaensis TaxID=130454 RepID=UPI0007AF60D2|nr:probable indole-3-pyruvate monooxygenase YUCCA10 [Arachis ipaensis]